MPRVRPRGRQGARVGGASRRFVGRVERRGRPRQARRRQAVAGLLQGGRRALQTGAQDGPDSSEGAGESITARAVRGARDSRLTQTLAPLMASGARTFMLCTVSPLPDDHLDTLNTLRVAQRCARIDAACVRASLPRNTGGRCGRGSLTLREAVARADAVADAALVSAGARGGGVDDGRESGGASGEGRRRRHRADPRRRRRVPARFGSAGCWRRFGSAGCSRARPSPIKAARIPAGLMPGRTPPRTQPSNLMRSSWRTCPSRFDRRRTSRFDCGGRVGDDVVDRSRRGRGRRAGGPAELGPDSSSAEFTAHAAVDLKDEFVAMYAAVDPGRREGAAPDAQRDERRLRRTPPTSPGKYVGNRRVRWPTIPTPKTPTTVTLTRKENAPIATEAAGDGPSRARRRPAAVRYPRTPRLCVWRLRSSGGGTTLCWVCCTPRSRLV